MNIDAKGKALHFLVAVDGSGRSLAGVRWIAMAAAAGIHLRCTLLNVQQPLMSGEVGAIAPANIAMNGRERNAAYALEQASAILRSSGLPFAIEEQSEDAATAIVARAAALACDAIVIARRGQGALRAALLGSVSAAVIQRAGVPVVVIGAEPDGTPAPMRILVAIDGSESAIHAATFAATLAAGPGELHLLHVQSALVVAEAVFASRERVTEQGSGKPAQDALAKTREMIAQAGVKYTEHVVASDDPGRAILSAVREYGCSIVAMGTRGHSPLAVLLLGSVSQQILENGSFPVMLAR